MSLAVTRCRLREYAAMCHVCRLRVGSPQRTLTDVSSLQRRGARPALIVASRSSVDVLSLLPASRSSPPDRIHPRWLTTRSWEQQKSSNATMRMPT